MRDRRRAGAIALPGLPRAREHEQRIDVRRDARVVAQRPRRYVDAVGVGAPLGDGPAHRVAELVVGGEVDARVGLDHLAAADAGTEQDRRSAQQRLDADQAERLVGRGEVS